MYKEFYDLREYPFSITADPDFFFSSIRHEEAFAHLIFGINLRKGIILITGEIGTGKTTLCRTLLNKLDNRTKTAFILNPNFSETQLLQLIIRDLGIETKLKNKFDLINALNDFLLEETNAGNNVVLIIDESQNLSVRQLEQIRLLSNIETEKEKLLQIVLVGQPELLNKLNLDALRQLNQRVAVRYHIQPLNREEVGHYIAHRIDIAKFKNNPQEQLTIKNGKPEFTDEAINAIFDHTHGTPRMVNILCDRALLAGFSAEIKQINERIIHQCIREVGHR